VVTFFVAALSFGGAGAASAADTLTVSPTATFESGQPALSVPDTLSATLDNPLGADLELQVASAVSSDAVGVPTSAVPSNGSGVVSVVGTTVYVGDGTYVRRVGIVDSSFTSASQARIKIDGITWWHQNPASTTVPSAYGEGLLPVSISKLGGWSGDGGDPEATTKFANTAGITLDNQSIVTSDNYTYPAHPYWTRNNAIAIHLNLSPTGPIGSSGANLRGAAFVSDAFAAQVGDRISFKHRNNCGDTGDLCTSAASVNLWVGLLDMNDCSPTFNKFAAVAHASMDDNRGWTENLYIDVPSNTPCPTTAGNYKFVAMAGGSWPANATTNLELRTKVNLTDFVITRSGSSFAPTSVEGASVIPSGWTTNLLRHFTYRSTSPTDGLIRTLTYRLGGSGGAVLASSDVTVTVTQPGQSSSPPAPAPPVVVPPPVVAAPVVPPPPPPPPPADAAPAPPADAPAEPASTEPAASGEPEPFDPLGSPESIAAAAGAAALAAALAGGVAAASAGGGGGGSSSSDSSSSDSESVELDSLEVSLDEIEITRQSWGDRWAFLALPALAFLDKASHNAAVRVAPFSPVFAKMIVDGAYLRSIMGSLSLLLPLTTMGLGLIAGIGNEGQLAPPPWELFLIMAVIGNFDALAGFLGAAVFIGSTLAGAEEAATIGDYRMLFVVLFVLMAPGLLMTAFRPLRKEVGPGFAGFWDRISDLAIAPLLAGVAASTAVLLVPALSGLNHPVANHVADFGFFIAISAAARVLLEELATKGFPQRLNTINPSRIPESPGFQQFVAIAFSYAVWVFLTGALVGNVWQIYVGSFLFLFPTVLGKFQDRFPNVVWLWHILPQGLPGLVFALTIATATTALVMDILGLNPAFAAWNMVLLPLPLLLLALAGMFGRHGATEDQVRFSQRHPVVFRVGGVVVFIAALRLMGVI
jgi:hypothetical protein